MIPGKKTTYIFIERPPIDFSYKKLQSGTPNLVHTALAVPGPDREIREGGGGGPVNQTLR